MTDRSQSGEPADLLRFYESAYTSADPARGALYARWRALGAVGKADHVITLCRRAGLVPHSTLDVGCGDGALLEELDRRDFGGELHGAEISSPAVALALKRSGVRSVQAFDGRTLADADASRELGILSHVLEHVPDPFALLTEVARVCEAVIVEVPLEDNLSAGRPSKRDHALQVGHLQRLSRGEIRQIVHDSGLRIVGEVEDPLPREVHRFFAATPRARANATARWATRALIHRACPPVARQLFTVHYACLCVAET